jgi:transaldolase
MAWLYDSSEIVVLGVTSNPTLFLSKKSRQQLSGQVLKLQARKERMTQLSLKVVARVAPHSRGREVTGCCWCAAKKV